ncbi:hypothetical protein, partial [Litchfieldella qijiaojingensis]|uniref:hypothetical protein n=1 Tax=Litchfieldella qijiaojingensis TaxID=980347 RepID=UPI001E30CB52
ATYDEVATQITLLTHSAPDAAVDAGGSITEDLYEALIRRGYSVEDATAILSDEAFQDGVLASMKTIAEVSGPLMDSETPPEADASAPEDAAPSDVYYDDQGLPVVELETTVVTGERLPDTPAQVVLKGASEINAYLEAHPEQRQIVEIGLAVAQGPKGVIGLLVDKAIEHAPGGEKIAEGIYEGGKIVAEWVEGYDLEGDQDEDDRYLIGGGTFATDIVLGGMAPGGKKARGVDGEVAKDVVNKLDDALSRYNQNDIHHLFGRGGETPTKLLEEFGSPEAALREVQRAAQTIADGNYQAGSWVTVKVGNVPVSIKGIVIDGMFRISTMAKREF